MHDRRERSAWALAAILILTSCARMLGATDLGAPGGDRTSFHEIRVGEQHRNFILHLPPSPYSHPLPLLILLHGSSANANVIMNESGMNSIADSIGAIVVYPNGTGEIPYFRLFWNTGNCCSHGSGVRGADEEGMLAAIVDTLSRLYPIDHTRIGIAGFSDPGSMTYLLACDQSFIWTSAGVIAGKFPSVDCTPHHGVSTIVFHGTADHNIGYGTTYADAAKWAMRQHCQDRSFDSTTAATIADYSNCLDGAEVKLYSLIGGKHGWPGGKKSWPLAPAPPQSVDASRLFAEFVVSHPRSGKP